MKREEIITILYEISMQIDFSLPSDKLANKILAVYGRKLGCQAAGIVIFAEDADQDITHFRPRNILRKKDYLKNIACQCRDNKCSKDFCHREYQEGNIQENHYLFPMQEINGRLILIFNAPINELILKSLSDVNHRLEEALVFIRNQEQMAKEKALLQQQSKLADMGKMLGNITHQWKQPLTILNSLLFVTHRQMQKANISDDFVAKFKEQGDFAIDSLNQTINDFRDYLSPNKERKTFNLIDTYQMAKRVIGASLQHKNIKLTEKIETDIITMTGYPNELSHVLVNIIANAKDQIVDQKIENGEIELQVVRRNDDAIIKIKDNGGGIPDEIHSKIFNYYFSTKGEAGTGLGLDMSKKIVEDHMHGTIVTYNEDNGAVFEIQLPIREK